MFAFYHSYTQIASVMLVDGSGLCSRNCKMLTIIASVIPDCFQQGVVKLSQAFWSNLFVYGNEQRIDPLKSCVVIINGINTHPA